MRLNLCAITIISFVLTSTLCFSQNNCGHTLPGIACPMDTNVCANEIIMSSLTTASSLPSIEYAIIDNNTLATSGLGPAVVGVDQDGIFMPSDFGLAQGGNFSVIPVAYDLAQIQETIDDILFGTTIIIFFPATCCDAAILAGTDICGPLNAAGIFSGADVTSLEDASALVQTANNLLTIQELVANLESINNQLASAPTACGGGDVFCYAYGNACTYDIIPNIETITMNHTQSELIEAENIINSSAIVLSPNIVDYEANVCIEMTNGFETILGSQFAATIDDPCN